MPAIDYRAARAGIHLAEVLELIAYQPRWRRGEQWRGPCPLHRSRSARSRVFAAHLGKNVYHCFRCGAGGNALDLWAALTRQPLHAAVLDLCQRLGRPVPWLAALTAVPSHLGLHRQQRSPQETSPMPAP
jgi:DNA primase